MTTLEKLEELIYIGFKETDKKWQETLAQLDRLTKDTDRKIGDLSDKWGKFVEGIVAPAAVRLFNERGIVVTGFAQRVKRQHGEEGIEIDILATNGDYAVAIEVKSTLGVEDVKEHLARLQRFPVFFPEYRQHKLIGAVAGINIIEEADKFAYRQGLFIIAQSGETVTILNDTKFQPKIWTVQEAQAG